jgi:thiamine pyrophosphate-dependent acetolactate synthase large subunit-like protein
MDSLFRRKMRLVSRAFVSLAVGRGPAAVELPADLLRLRVTSNDARETETSKPQRVDPGAIAEAMMLLEGANRPMIMVGAGAIAERLGAPVVSHLQGRGILDSRHPLSIGRAEAFRMGVTLTSLWRSERVSTVRAGDGD